MGFCTESKELETWLMHCHERLKRERCLPTRHNAAWLHEFDRIEQVHLAGSSLIGCNSQHEAMLSVWFRSWTMLSQQTLLLC